MYWHAEYLACGNDGDSETLVRIEKSSLARTIIIHTAVFWRSTRSALLSIAWCPRRPLKCRTVAVNELPAAAISLGAERIRRASQTGRDRWRTPQAMDDHEYNYAALLPMINL